MSTAQFYQISGGLDEKNHLAAQLTEEHYRQQKRVLILCHDKKQALAFDEYLWTFKPSSFIPHNLLSEAMTPPPPVMVATVDETLPFANTVINLSQSIALNVKNPQHIIEIICDIEEEKKRLRGFYREYQTQGFKVAFVANATATM